jgi:hypothetical protein
MTSPIHAFYSRSYCLQVEQKTLFTHESIKIILCHNLFPKKPTSREIEALTEPFSIAALAVACTAVSGHYLPADIC